MYGGGPRGVSVRRHTLWRGNWFSEFQLYWWPLFATNEIVILLSCSVCLHMMQWIEKIKAWILFQRTRGISLADASNALHLLNNLHNLRSICLRWDLLFTSHEHTQLEQLIVQCLVVLCFVWFPPNWVLVLGDLSVCYYGRHLDRKFASVYEWFTRVMRI